jgi:hypothetical protein
VGGEPGGIAGVDDCVCAGVDVGIGVCVEVGDALSVAAGEIGDDGASGETWFCGDGVGLGDGDLAACSGVAVTVGDLRPAEGDAFVFPFGVGVGLGVGVCALRSTPRCMPRTWVPSLVAGVAEALMRALREEKNDRFGVGVGVGVGAALSVNATPSINTDIDRRDFQFMGLAQRVLIKACWVGATPKPAHLKNLLQAGTRVERVTNRR